MSVRKPINRRNLLAAVAAALPAARIAKAVPAAPPIQLHCDLMLDPAKEKELLDNYHNIFHPAIITQPGFVGVTLLKLRTASQGKPPDGATYRLIISFQTEEDRQRWTRTPTHIKAWPTIENTLVPPKYTALLYDIVE